MTPERFQEVSRIYREVAELTVAERPQYLVVACAGDEVLRAEVEALLRYDNESAFLDQPALELATQILAKDQSPALTGRQVGHCQLHSLLGRGGMGEVWLAEDTQLGRKVAVKLLPAAFTHDAERVRRFVQEARAASSLNHPNIITIHEIGQQNNAHYIVTEYVEGETLRTRLNNAPQKRLAPAEAVELAIQLATALAAAHEAGIIHRDIKPENVMVRRDGIVKVLDFGLAKLTEQPLAEAAEDAPTQARVKTQSGVVLGTASYMSPEQARGVEVDARTDLFSLGAVLYELVAGHAPFRGATLTDILLAVIDKEPPPLTGVPAELQQIIGQALCKERAERYQSSQALLDDLKVWQQGQAISSTRSATRPLLPVRQPLSKYRRAILGLLMLLLAAVAAVTYFSFSHSSTIDSLAVLPFVNVGANPDTEYLSDGLTDSLINGLSRLPKLKVMSRNSVFRYKGSETDAQKAGNALGVRAVLTGKVTQRGDELIVSAELVNVRDNSHLWGEQYNRKLPDLQAVQATIAHDISEKLRLQLSSAEQQRLTKRGMVNPEAYELYLKGRHAMNALGSDAEAKKGLEYFQRAVEKDPQFALAYAGLAEAYGELGNLGTTFLIAPAEAFTKAKTNALKAVGLDDTLAEAHTSLGRIAMSYEWDWANAEHAFKQAIALNPNYVPARHWYSHLLVCLGRFDESLEQSQQALAIDPLDLGMIFHLGFHYYNARQYERAATQFQKALAMNPNHSNSHAILGLVYAQQRRYDEAIAEVKKGLELGGPDERGNLGHIYALAGRHDEARKLLAELLEETKRKQVSALSVARIYAGLNEKEQSFTWLEKAIAERDPNITDPGLKVDVMLNSLRADARFADLLRRISLTP